MHDALILALQKLDQFSGEGSFEGWLKRLTVNSVLGKVRSEKSKQSKVDVDQDKVDQSDYSEPVTDDPETNEILDMIRTLPETMRMVFTLYVIEGFSHKEIAEKIGISESSSRSSLTRAREQIQKVYERMNAIAE
jgi:RNA polymerase sigma-70 factor (ECF subfamily)